jgi:hypothetical protein
VSDRVRFGPEAEAELQDAAHWYEDRHLGLGLAFLAAIDRAIEGIVQWLALISGDQPVLGVIKPAAGLVGGRACPGIRNEVL